MAAQAPPNVLIIVVDDISPYDLISYPEFGLPYAMANRIENELGGKGITFDIAWADATCSPTRAVIQTGRYGFRTGIGKEIQFNNNGVGLPATEVILPKLLDLYAADTWSHAAFGKWHLSHEDYMLSPSVSKPNNAPDVLGYSFYRGEIFALPGSQPYCRPAAGWNPWTYWESTPNADPILKTAFDTDVLIDRQTQDAIDWIQQTPASNPWLCYIAYQAPYELHRAPITGTYTSPIMNVPGDCERCSGNTQNRQCFVSYMESLDNQIGILLDAITAQYGMDWSTTTTVFFVGDNGTPMGVVHPGVNPGQHKATQTEGALRIPFIVAGASVPGNCQGARSNALVHTVDLFATIATIAGIDLNPGGVPLIPDLDSFDMTPVLADPDLQDPATATRTYIYSEIFPDNVSPQNLPVQYGAENLRIARDARYKYVFRPTSGPNVLPALYTGSGHRAGDEFYDLNFGEEPTIDNLNGPSPIDEMDHPGAENARTNLLSSIQGLLGVQ